MRIHSYTLNIDQFKEDFSSLYYDSDKEQVLENIIRIINESDLSISSFLKKVDSIEERDVQTCCRHAAVAQMYDAALEYSRNESCYVESSGYGEVLMIQLPSSTVVLSKYGDILIDEGEICTHSGTNYGRGFITRKIIDGQVSSKYGFIDNQGACVVPCVFDYIEAHLYEAPCATLGCLKFTMRIFGNIDSIDTGKLQDMIKDYDWYDYVCISKDSVLFALESSGSHSGPTYINEIMALENNNHVPSKPEELLEELRSVLSPLLISKEKLQEIVESKE